MTDKKDENFGVGSPVGRREFLKLGGAAIAGLSLGQWLNLIAKGQSPSTHPAQTQPAASGPATTQPAKAKAVIQLWLNGGPAHTDMFDPKSGIGEDYTGPYKTPIATNVAGIQIGQKLPLLAKQADKYSIIRSFTHPSNGHETAAYIVQTGSMPSGDLVYPAMGAVLAYKLGASSTLPPYVCVTSPLGRFSEAGFLGSRYAAFATGGNPDSKDFRVSGVVPPAGVTTQKLQDRHELLDSLDTFAADRGTDPQVKAAEGFEKQAYSLILGDARKAFDISQEKDDLRDQYGRHFFGQSCLLARRLVEGGVRYITINFGGWDTHTKHFEAMDRLLPMLDQGFAMLLQDLSQRGLLDSTIVTCGGEFGRTPKVANEAPWFGGRHHFCTVFSVVVSGGGFQGGKVVGSSDRTGEKVKDRPVYPWDLTSSMYKLLGVDPAGKLPHPRGAVARVSPPAPTNMPGGGILTEIM